MEKRDAVSVPKKTHVSSQIERKGKEKVQDKEIKEEVCKKR
jgi:hypothetical protein